MCSLSLDDLPEHERADVDKAMAMVNPYLQIAAVEWMAGVEETK